MNEQPTAEENVAATETIRSPSPAETARPGAAEDRTRRKVRPVLSILARRHGVAPNLLYRWRRLMTEGGAVAVQADDAVTGNAELRRLEERMRELERQLGRKTLEVEILKEALARSRAKKPTLLATSPLRDDFR